MKKTLVIAAVAIACAGAYAQNKAVDSPQPANSSKTDATLDMKADKRAAAKPGAKIVENEPASNPESKQAGRNNDAALDSKVSARNKKLMDAIDTDKDGMISQAEWDAFNKKRWEGLKLTNGMVARKDMNKILDGY